MDDLHFLLRPVYPSSNRYLSYCHIHEKEPIFAPIFHLPEHSHIATTHKYNFLPSLDPPILNVSKISPQYIKAQDIPIYSPSQKIFPNQIESILYQIDLHRYPLYYQSNNPPLCSSSWWESVNRSRHMSSRYSDCVFTSIYPYLHTSWCFSDCRNPSILLHNIPSSLNVLLHKLDNTLSGYFPLDFRSITLPQ